MDKYLVVSVERKIWLLAVGVLCLAAFSSLSLIWLRQQSSLAASEVVKLEREIKLVDRKLDAKQTKIAELHRPAFMVAYLDKSFRAPSAQQIAVISNEFQLSEKEALVKADPVEDTAPLFSISVISQ